MDDGIGHSLWLVTMQHECMTQNLDLQQAGMAHLYWCCRGTFIHCLTGLYLAMLLPAN